MVKTGAAACVAVVMTFHAPMPAGWYERPERTPGVRAAVMLEWAPTTHRSTGPAARTGGTDKFENVRLAVRGNSR